MKFIQTIIAFFTLYLFVGAIVVLLIVFNWFRSFVPDNEKQLVASIEVTKKDAKTGSGFTFNKVNAANALEVLITRNTSRATKDVEAVLAARSELLWAEYVKITLPDALVPVGFRSMYKLAKITDSSGRILYENKDPFLAQLESLGIVKISEPDVNLITKQLVIIPLLASSDTITYTLQVDETGLTQVNQNEN